MNRLIALMLTAALALCAAGCTGGELTPPTGAFTVADMGIAVDGKVYSIRSDSAPLIAALGDDYEYSYSVSCVYDGDDKLYDYAGISVSTVPVDGKDIIEMITIDGAGYATLRGVGIGAALEDIVAAYGEDYFDDGYITYTYDNDPADYNAERIQFELDAQGVVTRIFIYSPSY
ncbi:MAG: hypothetical protein Q4B99_06455 [Clostridia bacterium]|nr:hypothetical protein [Clostridia bacterium]